MVKEEKKEISTGLVVGLSILGVFIFAALIFVGWIWGSYNTFVVATQDINNQWSNVKTEYQRRSDLILNMAEVVKGYSNFEKETLVDVTKARNINLNQGTKEEQLKQAGELDSILSRLMLVFEQYPNLKSIEQYNKLSDELKNTENRVNIARTDYNSLVRSYNILITKFPKNILANSWGYRQEQYFEVVTATAEKAPKLDMS